MFDKLVIDEWIKVKHRTFIDLYYIQWVRSPQQAKEYGISERTYYRRKKEVHFIIQENWQKNSRQDLQNHNQLVNRVIATFI